ncbi:12075_t:CDS:2 [Acaulospora colombiana]|uniref:12075_t:CDS:1 n=1 Tax=Acaulospora colombiana TaxID=27376 RepID=A0ACA9M3X4_9GLOM|nr:12075_t:CDS:2 [Acaulospora colombiana]
MASTTLPYAAFFLILMTSSVDASWRMYANTLITARIDPLISPGRHVHDYVGGNNFGVTYDYNTQMQSSCSSVQIQADKSGYWMPSVYYRRRDGTFQLLRSSYMVYYLHRGSRQTAFPAGFRMIAGSNSKSSSTPGNPADEAINFHCLDTNAETLDFPNQYCPAGVRLVLADLKDHVAYPVDGKEGNTCPSTHPVRLITLFLEHVIDMKDLDWYPGCITMSNGDTKGFSSHADFIMGWDTGLLQQVIDQCTDPQADLSTCGVLMQSNNGDLAGQCQPVKNLPLEDVGFYGSITRLLGDNAVWGDGISKNSIGSTPTPPLVAPYSVVPNNWNQVGCINEGDPYTNTMNGDKVVDQFMTPQQCVKNCNDKGFSIAGLENDYEWCGGGRNLRIWTKRGDAAADSLYEYPPAGSHLTTVYTTDGSTANIDGNSPYGPNNPPRCPPRRPKLAVKRDMEVVDRIKRAMHSHHRFDRGHYF